MYKRFSTPIYLFNLSVSSTRWLCIKLCYLLFLCVVFEEWKQRLEEDKIFPSSILLGGNETLKTTSIIRVVSTSQKEQGKGSLNHRVQSVPLNKNCSNSKRRESIHKSIAYEIIITIYVSSVLHGVNVF